ncbi:MAG: neutral/alkaline non-lysosomal ceramidase N-terminal domain-containing protein [Verrucomicrobiales bacterium]|nr:neutral/alkaline non-lysosomal ceramidase N-terminal domain-containing protein [Verrucomicrobiales bacterium]
MLPSARAYLSRFITMVLIPVALSATLPAAGGADTDGMIGVARRDVTPAYPIRLTGYAARTNMANGVEQKLWAKALALGSDAEGPRLLVTVDNCGVPAGVVEEVARRLGAKAKIDRAHFAVASSHTHSGPMVRGFAENIFIRDLTPEEAAASDRYTAEITDHLEAVALEALAKRQPGRLSFGQGSVGFAANRRTAGGPVDHSLPALVAKDRNGKVVAVVANYACHCTTLGHQVNRHHGDWAGFAQEFIEADHPGAIAMVTVGCGADSNPSPRGGDDFGVALARGHARSLATVVGQLAADDMQALPVVPATKFERIALPFQTLPTIDEWKKRAQEPAIVGYHARKNLARLERGEVLPTEISYPVQCWAFGDRLAMVFLGGEVVVDYVHRLKGTFDASRLWVTAYANDVPGYIPSRRILDEGGYEAETSLWYYDRPARFSPAIEDKIHEAVGRLMPPSFRATASAPEKKP